MIIERYDPARLFDLVPELTLAMDPELAQLDGLLDDDPLFQQVKADLARRAPHSLTRGRRSPPVEVILRMLVVRRLYAWCDEDTEQFVADSLVLRQFCRLGLERAPDDTTLIRWAQLIRPTTWAALNDRVGELARQVKVTRGRKRRTDGTVVETTMHPPTDSSLLADGVRVLSRLLKRAQSVLGAVPDAGADLFRDRTRAAKRLARPIGEAVRRRGEAAEATRQAAYRRLVQVTEASLEQASRIAGLRSATPITMTKLAEGLTHFVPRIEQVVDQTCRRVCGRETVSADAKRVSLFEPHPAILRRGKAQRDVEFGRKIWLDEVEGGIIRRFTILPGNPSDDQQFAASLAHHQHLFGRPPDLVAGDRGVHSADNEARAHLLGVKHVALPQPGHRSLERQAYERQGWFRRALRFRAGGEGRISVLKRREYRGRCREKGEDGFGRWVGWGVIVANLTTISRTVAARS
jgi:IS5 family transposase